MVTFLVNRDGVNERAGFAVVDGDADGFGGVTFAVALRCASLLARSFTSSYIVVSSTPLIADTV